MPAMRPLPSVRRSGIGRACAGLVAAVLSLAACASSPALQKPLVDRLAKSDTSQIEDATRACLTEGGWKVDPIAELVNGSRKVTGSKDKVLAEVYINPPDMKPRVTGGPDYNDGFWKCLGPQLKKGPATDAPAASSDTP